ncbi:MAG: AI-2E family transporter [Actinomycetota bacterium]
MPDLQTVPPIERFRRAGIVVWTLIGILILAYIAMRVLTRVEEIFPPVVVALVSIYTLNPLVTRLEGFGIRRIFGGCLTYLLLVGVAALALVLLIPVLIDQGQALARDLPQTVDRFGDFANSVGENIQQRFGADVNFRDWIGGRSDFVADLVGNIGLFITGAAQTIALIVIGLVVGFYLLIDLPRLQRSSLRLVPPDRREEMRELSGAVGSAMGGFFRGQLLVAFIVGVMSSLGLWLIGLPYWAVVGAIAGFFNIVPLIGPFVGAVPAVLIALALKPPITVLWVAVVLTIVQQIDNHFISPNVMRWSVSLHPVTVMFSLTVGAALAGFFGMLVAVPIAASLKVVAAHFWRTRVPWGHEVFEDADVERGPPHLRESTSDERPDVPGGSPPDSTDAPPVV